MTIDKQALLGADKHANQHRLSRLIVEANSAEIRAIAEAVEQYTDQLIAALADAKNRIAELERSETQLINERDAAESALNDAYKAVMGHAPEWSNWFSFENAIDEIELACELWRNQTDDVIQFRQHIANLEAQKADLMRHVLNAYEASALTMTLRKTVGYLPDYLRFCGIYGVDHDTIIDKLDYQSFVLARVNNEDLRQDEAACSLVEENEELKRKLESENQRNTALTAKIEPMDRRIAELEARTVNLSKLSVDEVMHMSGFSRDYAEGWCAGNDNAIHEIRAAGIKVKE